MISAMPAVAVRREREKNRQGKLVGDPFGRGANYIPGHQLHLPISYYHPHHHHHHHHHSSSNHRCNNNNSCSSDCVTSSTQNSQEKAGLRFLIYSGFGCLAIGLICLFIGIVTIKLPTQIIGLVFIGLGGLFCVIKVILSGKSSSSSPSPRVTTTTTTRVETNVNCGGDGDGDGGTRATDNNSNNLNLIRSSNNNQSLVVDPKQTVKLPSSHKSINNSKPTAGSSDCLNQTSSSKPIDQQYLEAS